LSVERTDVKKMGYTSTKAMNKVPVPANAKPGAKRMKKKGKKK
jgi:hypothetical protein